MEHLVGVHETGYDQICIQRHPGVDYTIAGLKQIVEEALSSPGHQWADDDKIRFGIGDVECSELHSSSDADIWVNIWDLEESPFDWPCGTSPGCGAKIGGLFPHNSAQHFERGQIHLDVHVFIDATYTYENVPGVGDVDVERGHALNHEMGHILGLADVCQGTAEYEHNCDDSANGLDRCFFNDEPIPSIMHNLGHCRFGEMVSPSGYGDSVDPSPSDINMVRLIEATD